MGMMEGIFYTEDASTAKVKDIAITTSPAGCKIKRDHFSRRSFAPSRGRYRFIMQPLAPNFPAAVLSCSLYQITVPMPEGIQIKRDLFPLPVRQGRKESVHIPALSRRAARPRAYKPRANQPVSPKNHSAQAGAADGQRVRPGAGVRRIP